MVFKYSKNKKNNNQLKVNERFARSYAETVPFHKIFKPGNQVNLRYFSQW